jgi:hypothetical protein
MFPSKHDTTQLTAEHQNFGLRIGGTPNPKPVASGQWLVTSGSPKNGERQTLNGERSQDFGFPKSAIRNPQSEILPLRVPQRPLRDALLPLSPFRMLFRERYSRCKRREMISQRRVDIDRLGLKLFRA